MSSVSTGSPRSGTAVRPTGLTTPQVEQLQQRYGRNALPAPSRPTLAARVGRELREPMALLLIAAATVSGVVLGEAVDATAILVIVAINAIIALLQEGRAERSLDALEQLEAPSATVVRDGRRRIIDAAELVPGDLVVLQAGDRVPADGRVATSDSIETDESILTGESLAVPKRPDGATGPDLALGDRDGMVHSGTLLTRGSGTAVVTATGLDTALGSIAKRLHDIRREPTPLQRQLAGLTRRLGGAAVVVASATFALMVTVSDTTSVEDAFLTAVALAVAAVPEGLAAVTTVALALGVGRMAQRGAIVRRLPAVETLGATDVLVTDKTGTVTENRMRLTAVIAPDGTVHEPDRLPVALRGQIVDVLVLCNDATLDPPTGDPTEQALLEIVGDATADAMRLRTPRLAAEPFTSDRKRMSSLHELDDGLTLLVKGAPEVVLPRCSTTADAVTGQLTELSSSVRRQLLATAEEHAGRGERLLALARRPMHSRPAGLADHEHGLTMVGIVALRDPLRASAAASVAAIRQAGVTLIMATGDHPATAASVAAEAGLSAGPAITGPALERDGMPDDPAATPIYARIDPEQKLELVDAFQRAGHVVAMTGDGVNDAPALRSADIGVALGAAGSDVAREAADLVITDDDLATIVAAIHEGRGIYDNLRKVIDYLVASNLAEVLVVLSTVLLLPAFGVPLFPLQLLWINLLTDGLPALALGVTEASPGLLNQPPRDASSRLLDRAHLRHLGARALVLAGVALGSLLVATEVLELEQAAARTVLFSTLVLAQVLYAFVVQDRQGGHHNRWLIWSSAAALVLHVMIVVAPAAQGVFRTAPLEPAAWALVVVGGVGAPGLIWSTRAVRRRRADTGARGWPPK